MNTLVRCYDDTCKFGSSYVCTKDEVHFDHMLFGMICYDREPKVEDEDFNKSYQRGRGGGSE